MKKRYILATVFSLLVVGYVLVRLDWKATLETFTHLHLIWLTLALGIYLLNYLVRTIRFRLLLNLEAIPFWQLFGVTNLYGMYLYLMPAKFGEVSYPLLLKNRMDVALVESTATLIVARLFDFATIALFLPAVLAAYWRQIHPLLRIGSLVFVALVLLLTIILLWFLRLPTSTDWFQKRALASRQWVHRLWNAAQRLTLSLQLIDKRKQYATLFLLTVFIWLCVQLNFYCIIISLGYTLSFFQMIVVSLIMVPMTLLPLQGFANLGTHEIGWTAAFALFGYSERTALTIAFSTHVILLAFVLLLGLLGMVLLKGARSTNAR